MGYNTLLMTPRKDTNIKIIKVWDDMEDKHQLRPKTITVRLFTDGVKVDEVVLSQASEWQHEFIDLAKYKQGKEIVYTIDEVSVKDYQTKVDGFTITNKVIEPPKKPELPKTGSASHNYHLYGMLIAGLGLMLLKKKKED